MRSEDFFKIEIYTLDLSFDSDVQIVVELYFLSIRQALIFKIIVVDKYSTRNSLNDSIEKPIHLNFYTIENYNECGAVGT